MPDSAFWSHGSEICFSFLVNFISSYNDTTEVTRLANSYSFNSVVNISVSLFSFLCELIWFFFLIFVWICSGLLFFIIIVNFSCTLFSFSLWTSLFKLSLFTVFFLFVNFVVPLFSFTLSTFLVHCFFSLETFLVNCFLSLLCDFFLFTCFLIQIPRNTVISKNTLAPTYSLFSP